ncbi:hypothetical protein A4A49_57612, partial [Nicotiana attenuata]
LISLIFLCVTKLATSQSPLVSDFCHKGGIQEPNFCLRFLGLDSRSKTATSAHDLEGITIDWGSEYAKTVTSKALSFLQSATDPKVEAALSACVQAYTTLNFDFNTIRAAFQSGTSIAEQAANARLAVSNCNQAFSEKQLLSPLANDNNKLLSFIQIILANGV